MTDFDPKMIEAVARAICLSEGQDPDATNILVFCDHDNRPLPIWMACEEQAQAALSALPLSPKALTALWEGEAVVAAKSAHTQAGNVLFNLKQRSPGSALTKRDIRTISEVSALLDASPFAPKE